MQTKIYVGTKIDNNLQKCSVKISIKLDQWFGRKVSNMAASSEPNQGVFTHSSKMRIIF